jgi:hypothetical protein
MFTYLQSYECAQRSSTCEVTNFKSEQIMPDPHTYVIVNSKLYLNVFLRLFIDRTTRTRLFWLKLVDMGCAAV